MNTFYEIVIKHPVVPIFLLINLAIGYWAHRKACVSSFEDYALASCSLPTGVLVMTLLATFIGSGELHFPNLVADCGIVGGFITLGVFFSFVLIGKFVANELTNFHGAITLGDLMHILYGRPARLIGGLVGALLSFFVIVTQMRAMGSISVHLLNMNHVGDSTMAIVCFSTLIVMYSVWGGIRAVTYTDVLQGVMALMVIGWVMKTMVQDMGGISTMVEKIATKHPEKLDIIYSPKFAFCAKRSSFWWSSGIFTLSLPIFQRMLMVRGKKQARNIWYVSACFYLLFGCMLILLGLGATIREIETSTLGEYQSLLLHIIKDLFKGKNLTMDVIFLGLLGILFSTADSFLHAMGITLVHDIIEPMRSIFGRQPLEKQKKISYAKISIALIGGIAILIGATKGSSLFSEPLYEYGAFIYVMVLAPLLFGILGLKTDVAAWIGFCVSYLMSLLLLYQLGWAKYDYFHASLFVGCCGFISIHVIQYKGFVVMKRGMYTVSEEVWSLSWQGIKDMVRMIMGIMLEFPCVVRRQVLKNPVHPLVCSFMVFALYMFSSLISSSSMEVSNYIMGIRAVGIVLCCGLIIEDIWPDHLKVYFPYFWCFTLLYCLPFSSTFIFFHTYQDSLALAQWFISFVVLMFLVGKNGFALLSILGAILAVGACSMGIEGFPSDIWLDIEIAGWYGLLVLFVCILLFSRSNENEVEDQMYWQYIASNRLSDEATDPLQMLGGLGHVLQNAFSAGKVMKDSKGEEGFWIKTYQYQFLNRFAGRMTKKSKEVKKDLSRFTRFIEQHILGAFTQERASIRSLVEKSIAQTMEKYHTKVQVKLISKEDFQCDVLVSVFPNAIGDLIENSVVHGQASEIEVNIDSSMREIRIRDNGIGIPSSVLPYVFELRYTDGGGRGIGLPFLRMVTEAAGGKVTCYSKYGVADSFSEFVITLP